MIPIRAPTVALDASPLVGPTFPSVGRVRRLSVGSTGLKRAVCITPVRKRPRWKRIVEATAHTVVGISLGVCVSIASASAQQQAPTVVPVGTVQAEHKPIAKTKNFVGRVEAINKVEVHARVTGYLEDVRFKEGELVKEGQPLYHIEKDLFQAAVDQAAGQLADDKAKKLLTAIEFQRADALTKTSAGTVEARDKALTADRDADAQIMIAQGKLDTAKINLSYTDIVSPIAGKIGRTKITKGNVVSPESGTLTTIVSQDPMYVLFPVSQADISHARDTGLDIEGIKVRLRFADGKIYEQVGKIDFVDVTVDRATDTVQARAVFPNPSGALIDGQLWEVNLEAGKPEEQVVVPQAALLTDQQGVYVFVVEDGKVAIRRIKTGGASGENIIVTEGLSGNELVVVQGLEALRPGMAVRATPVTAALNRS
jgi:membrane fusion protein, multidrug efflux system